MPISNKFTIPTSANLLALPSDPNHKFYIAFISSIDPTTKQSWCPDVRAALPHIKAAFSSDDGPEVAFVEVGMRPEWKDPKNIYRINWNVHNVPTLVRYQRVDGEVRETGRLVEDEILNEKKLSGLVGGVSK
ncbi:thioredoxin-like protein [Halenospora varia]|nr:thioredoxin-like protein [Halenospora varia]